MEQKSNKELAVEAAVEYVKSWNAAEHTTAVNSTEFINILKSVYNAICEFDNEQN